MVPRRKKLANFWKWNQLKRKDQIIADVLKNGRQALVKHENVLVPDVYSGEINKSRERSATTADESSEDESFINKIKDENNDH